MIKGYCFTNLDGFENESWPEEFVAIPREGERIESKNYKELKVVKITHTMREIAYNEGVRFRGDFEPCIRIELSK